MHTNKHELLLAEEVFQVVGCAMEVANTIGGGLLEKPYENALVVELGIRGIPYQQQVRVPVVYKGVDVGLYIPDLIAFRQIIIECKVLEKISGIERAQLINYLKITGLHVGLLLNFRHAKLEWERVVL